MIRDCHWDTRKRLLAHAALKGRRILEVGCGTGRVSRMYADEARLTVGIEPELQAVCRAAREVPDVSFTCGSGMHLPFADGSFDVVLFTLSLHHHPDCLAALDEARRVIANDGAVLVLEPTPESEIQRFCKPFEDEDHKLIAVEESLKRCSLEIASKEAFDTCWEFSDFEDAADYPFAHYNHPPDEEKREALRRFLGPKGLNTPIEMTDTLRLTCLRPAFRES